MIERDMLCDWNSYFNTVVKVWHGFMCDFLKLLANSDLVQTSPIIYIYIWNLILEMLFHPLPAYEDVIYQKYATWSYKIIYSPGALYFDVFVGTLVDMFITVPPFFAADNYHLEEECQLPTLLVHASMWVLFSHHLK